MSSEEGVEKKERKRRASQIRKNSLSQPRQLGSVKEEFWLRAEFIVRIIIISLAFRNESACS